MKSFWSLEAFSLLLMAIALLFTLIGPWGLSPVFLGCQHLKRQDFAPLIVFNQKLSKSCCSKRFMDGSLQSLQSLQQAGLTGFPPGLAIAAAAGGDAKNPAAVLPLMPPGVAGLPSMFGLGGLLNVAAGSPADPEDAASRAEEKGGEHEDESKGPEKSIEAGPGPDSANGSVGAAAGPAGLPSNPLASTPSCCPPWPAASSTRPCFYLQDWGG